MHTQSPSFATLTARAWPGPHVRELDGWLLRSAGGVSNRANSVVPLRAPADLAEAIVEVERHYRRLGQASVFQVGPDSEPAGLDEVLAARGYRVVTPTLVQQVVIAEALARLPEPSGVLVTGEPTEAWLDLHWQESGRTTAATRFITQQILTGVPAGYADLGGQAIARGALVEDWVGLYSMYCRPECRRRGLARTVLAGLLRWAADRGATRAFLQVVESNEGARRLYAGAGFTDATRYHYRVLD
ncbi:GNAT superfamily N-acetyltransferase [Crossiella equi]|uniref:GNAT superfamily N-acetyltransferase n=1 Tax=Crossiella equi TaxID=130796 RepID=A0ABS5AF91_9PSEU|nr:GNAT family N-acetyltransferase [Crossiella equi]MBP2474932.1 GNAT superfamily N-acetyltransferase [Crossiella equi]